MIYYYYFTIDHLHYINMRKTGGGGGGGEGVLSASGSIRKVGRGGGRLLAVR